MPEKLQDKHEPNNLKRAGVLSLGQLLRKR